MPCNEARRGIRADPFEEVDVLLYIEGQKWQVQHQREPVPVDKEEEGQEAMDGSFWDDVGVETVAEIDRIDVITI